MGRDGAWEGLRGGDGGGAAGVKIGGREGVGDEEQRGVEGEQNIWRVYGEESEGETEGEGGGIKESAGRGSVKKRLRVNMRGELRRERGRSIKREKK